MPLTPPSLTTPSLDPDTARTAKRTLGTDAVTGRLNLVLAVHLDSEGDYRPLDAAYLPVWCEEALTFLSDCVARGIPVHLQPDPAALAALLGDDGGVGVLEAVRAGGGSVDVRTHAGGMTVLGEMLADLQDAKDEWAEDPLVLGSYELGTESAYAAPPQAGWWFAVLSGGDTPGHPASDAPLVEGIVATGASWDGTAQVAMLTGTAASTANKRKIARMVRDGTIQAGISMVRGNGLPRRQADGTWGPSWATPTRHAGTDQEQAPVPLLEDLDRMLAEVATTSVPVTWWLLQELAAEVREAGLVGVTYEVENS